MSLSTNITNYFLGLNNDSNFVIGQENKPALIINSLGEISFPNKPAFEARLSNDLSTVASNYGFEASLNFDDAKISDHKCYNTTTGEFTAPTESFYHFDAAIIHKVGVVIQVILQVGDRKDMKTCSLETFTQIPFHSCDISKTVSMKALEKAQIAVKYIYSGFGSTTPLIIAGKDSFFSGFQIA